ncbi:unnamed protein product [Diamesa serratosioi]
MLLKLVVFAIVVINNCCGTLTGSEINTNSSIYFRDQSLLLGHICEQNGVTGTCKEIQLCSTAFISNATLLCSNAKENLICCPYDQDQIWNTAQLETTLLPSDWKSLDECVDRNSQCIDNFDLKFWNVENMPHLALLGSWNSNETLVRCVGSLITDQFIITTAVCAGQPNDQVNFAIITDRTLKTPIVRSSTILLVKVILHPTVNLAVIKMNNKQILHRYLRPACLWPTSSQIPIDLESISWELKNTEPVHQEVTVKTCQFRDTSFCAVVTKTNRQNVAKLIESPLFFSTSQIVSKHGDDKLRNLFYLIGLKDAGNNLYLNPSFEKTWIEEVINNHD